MEEVNIEYPVGIEDLGRGISFCQEARSTFADYQFPLDMNGYWYCCDALKLYSECLIDRASCVLQKDVYNVLARRYCTTAACIDMSIRRWIQKAWQNPDVRKRIREMSGGWITKCPSSKQLIHLFSTKMVRAKLGNPVLAWYNLREDYVRKKG